MHNDGTVLLGCHSSHVRQADKGIRASPTYPPEVPVVLNPSTAWYERPYLPRFSPLPVGMAAVEYLRGRAARLMARPSAGLKYMGGSPMELVRACLCWAMLGLFVWFGGLSAAAEADIDSTRLSGARAELNAALAIDPADPQARLTSVMLPHRFDKTPRYFQAAVDFDPPQEHYTLALAHTYKETQQGDAALRLFETAFDGDPEKVSLYKELAYLHLHQGHNNDEVVQRFRQGIDQPLNDPELTEEGTRDLERDIEQMRSEVQRLTHRFDLTLYQTWRSNTQPVRTSPSVFGEGIIPSQGGLTMAYQPPVIGFRDERILQIFGRLLWSTEPRSLNVDDDSLQASLGIRYKPLKQVNAYVSAERLFKIGSEAEDNWLLRVTSGWDRGTRLATGESFWPYSFLYGDLGYFIEHGGNLAFYGEARQGLAVKVGKAVMLTPHLVLDGRYQTLDSDLNSYLEGGLGASLKYFFNATRYETPRSSLEFLVQYKIGLIESASGWVITGILQF